MQLFNAIFRKNADFATLNDKVQALSLTQKIWHDIVPEPLKSATHAGNIEHKRLTVYAKNGAIAAKIKLLLPSLLTKLQKKGVEISSIRVQIEVQAQAENPEKASRALSDIAAKNVGLLAEQLKGTALGDALQRLSERTNK